MKKIALITFILCLVMLVFLSSCGTEKASNNEDKNKPSFPPST